MGEAVPDVTVAEHDLLGGVFQIDVGEGRGKWILALESVAKSLCGS